MLPYGEGSDFSNIVRNKILRERIRKEVIDRELNKVEEAIDNLNATTDPTSNDNLSDGYKKGSRWFNKTSGAYFICVESSRTSAVWQYIFTQVPTTIQKSDGFIPIAGSGQSYFLPKDNFSGIVEVIDIYVENYTDILSGVEITTDKIVINIDPNDNLADDELSGKRALVTYIAQVAIE